MSDSEVNRLKTGAFTFRFETLPHLVLSVSPHVSHLVYLTLLVISSRDKWNLICDVEVCAGLFFRFYSAPTRSRDIFCLFTFLMKDRDRLTNKSLICTKLYLFYSSCQESWIYWLKNVNKILLPTRNKVSQRGKKLYKNCYPYYNLFCQDIIRLC